MKMMRQKIGVKQLGPGGLVIIQYPHFAPKFSLSVCTA